MQVLERADWRARAAAHETRVDAWIQPHLERRRTGVKHPVHDFLFGYYSHRPSALRRWHPGFGVVLLDAPEYAEVAGYDEAPAGVVRFEKRRPEEDSGAFRAGLPSSATEAP